MNHTTIQSLISNNEYDKAIEQIDLLLHESPCDDEAYYLKAKIYQRQSKWSNAIETYKKAIELNKDSKAVTALEMLYDILNSMNNEVIET